MKLSRLTIRHFKGIEELSIDIENISLIIGPNNCGKSTILQALELFGSVKKIPSSLYHNHDTTKPISFHATFTNVTPEEAEMHGLRASLHEETSSFIVRAIYPYGEDVKRASKLRGEETHDLEDDGWEGKLGGGKDGIHFINVFPEVIYIPAVKDANDDIKDNSIYMKTLTALYKEVIQSLPEYELAKKETQLLQDKINAHDDPKIKFFETEVQTFLKDVTSTKITFNVKVDSPEELVKTSIKPFFNYNGLDTELINQGNGVQRTFILSIFQGFRKYKQRFTMEGKEKKTINRPLIIALEEPELYLHPQLVRVFKDTLYSLADDGYFQILATSHSPNFIDLSKPHRTLAKLTLDTNKKVCINQVGSDIYGLPSEEKERFQALLKFNPFVNEVFFAENVILVEGDTEVVALKLIGEKLVDAGLLDADVFYRTSVVNCAGKGTMYVLLNVLNNFGIKYNVIHDFDITEFNSKGERRTVTALKSVLTLNYKLERLSKIRENNKYVFLHTFEAEMPPEYEKGSSKSFTAFEFLKDKSLDSLPVGLVKLVKSAYGIQIKEPLDHSIENLLIRYSWKEINEAKTTWAAPSDYEYIIKLWQ